jgi:D-alanyl-D-alanine carboxypeptidase/D-alanyl-D-alanine-endopeptidase (penicillin-binding protein 4)
MRSVSAARAHRAPAALALAVLLAGGCAGTRPAPSATPAPSPVDQLRLDVAAAVSGPGVAAGTWGVVVRSLARDETLVALNPDALLVPASVAKIVTLATAADAVGWDHTFRTTVFAAGTLADGVLDGDLVVTGSGDPTIDAGGRTDLAAWAAALRAGGLTRVTGRVVGDDDAATEPRPRFAWAWDDLGYPYGALPGALNTGANAVAITLATGPRPGLPAALRTPGDARHLPVTSTVTTTAAGAAPALQPILQPGGLGLHVLGTLPLDSAPVTFEVAVGNPTLWFVTMLRERLQAAGIAVDGPPVDIDNLPEGPASGPASMLLAHDSPPLAALAVPMMHDSLNLDAETVLWLSTGPDGVRDTDAALDAQRARLAAWGIADDAHQLVDGSGLSRRSTVTAQALVGVLERTFGPDDSPWMRALPVAGRDGTLERRFLGTPAEGNLRAKTGSMSNIRALAGYVTTRDGEPLAFAILLNNFEGTGAQATAAIDRIASALAGFTR